MFAQAQIGPLVIHVFVSVVMQLATVTSIAEML
jgi:hypothetical protein